jgi:hypothetical protein
MRLVFAALAIVMVPGMGHAQWKAGAAKVSITPRGPLFQSGYGSRTRPAESAAQELYAKALAVQDPSGAVAVLVTSDMLGFPASLSKAVADAVNQKYGIRRDRLSFNSSHTHCGPAVSGMEAAPSWAMKSEDLQAIEVYTKELKEKLVALIGEAIANQAPARVSFGKTGASFGIHRRMPGGKIWGPNYAGPADRDVPVLRVEGESGKVRAVAFGYACHPSTLGINQFHGDYAGSAQKWLEERYPGAVALFVMGCGGDVKPYPNQSIELADSYGAMLGAAVHTLMSKPLSPISGLMTTAFETVALDFAEPPTRAQLNERLKTGNSLMKRHAEVMLKTLDRGDRLPTKYSYPVQAWQFGKDFTFIAMGGEVVSEYALRLKKELGDGNLWIAGYSNDVFAYIPSRRILEEGGYEAGVSSMEFYLKPGPWTLSVEETVVSKVHEVVKRVREAKR